MRMRIFAVFLFLFLMTLFFGTLSYVWLLWNTYWSRIEKLAVDHHYLNRRGNQFEIGRKPRRLKNSRTKDANENNKESNDATTKYKSNIANQHQLDHKIKKDASEFRKNTYRNVSILQNDKILRHVTHHKDQIVSHLKLSLDFAWKTGQIKNIYNVPGYSRRNIDLQTKKLRKKSSQSKVPKTTEDLILDAFDKIKLKTFLRNNTFFNREQLGPYLPEKPFEIFDDPKLEKVGVPSPHYEKSDSNKKLGLQNSCPIYKYKNCGVVSSAGSLLHSGLGKNIDSNDFVIRFNNAPTKGFEMDVGNKTNLRIVNSQVVGKPEFGFLDDRHSKHLYTNTPILVWDPCNYNSTLEEWYTSPDFPFFESYFKKRLMRPDAEVHLLDPRSLWSIWNWLQSLHQNSVLLPNPPSSGFLGLILAVLHCQNVHVYEFVPSMRFTKRCHYYDEQQNIGCTIGDWHPLAAEKLAALKMNVGNDTQVFQEGFVTIPGILSLKDKFCAGNNNSVDISQ